MDVIAQCAFSTQVNTEQNPDDEFAIYARKLADTEFGLAALLISTVFFTLPLLGCVPQSETKGKFSLNPERRIRK